MNKWIMLLVLVFGLGIYAGEPKEGVRFLEPKSENGKPITVPSKFKMKFGVWGKKIAPAGSGDERTGHHHVLVWNKKTSQGHDSKNVWNASTKKGKPVPVAATSIHYGLGQTEAELTLPPGEYKLTLQLADRNHVAYDPKVWSHEIDIIVK